MVIKVFLGVFPTPVSLSIYRLNASIKELKTGSSKSNGVHLGRFDIGCYTLIVLDKNGTSLGEEILNSITHGVGLLFVIIGFCILIVFSSKNYDFIEMLGIIIFGFSVFLTYIFSTLYHSLYFTKARGVFERLDHASIFILISGTYTPFILIALKNNKGLMLLLFVWLFAIFGVLYKIIFINKLKKLQLSAYIILGWIGIFLVEPLVSALPANAVVWLVLGGCLYTFGTIFYSWRKLRFNYGIRHLIVLLGTFCHYIALSMV